MNAGELNATAALLSAIAWPVTVVLIAFKLKELVAKSITLRMKFLGYELHLEPTQGMRPPKGESGQSVSDDTALTRNVGDRPDANALPFDYFYLNHTSFLREDKQTEFVQRTKIDLPHYDIRVVVDSYYDGALDRVDQVEYILHSAYPIPKVYNRNKDKKFLLKELAHGEYVLIAKVYLIDRKMPVLLQRYITLWESGPPLP